MMAPSFCTLSLALLLLVPVSAFEWMGHGSVSELITSASDLERDDEDIMVQQKKEDPDFDHPVFASEPADRCLAKATEMMMPGMICQIDSHGVCVTHELKSIVMDNAPKNCQNISEFTKTCEGKEGEKKAECADKAREEYSEQLMQEGSIWRRATFLGDRFVENHHGEKITDGRFARGPETESGAFRKNAHSKGQLTEDLQVRECDKITLMDSILGDVPLPAGERLLQFTRDKHSTNLPRLVDEGVCLSDEKIDPKEGSVVNPPEWTDEIPYYGSDTKKKFAEDLCDGKKLCKCVEGNWFSGAKMLGTGKKVSEQPDMNESIKKQLRCLNPAADGELNSAGTVFAAGGADGKIASPWGVLLSKEMWTAPRTYVSIETGGITVAEGDDDAWEAKSQKVDPNFEAPVTTGETEVTADDAEKLGQLFGFKTFSVPEGADGTTIRFTWGEKGGVVTSLNFGNTHSDGNKGLVETNHYLRNFVLSPGNQRAAFVESHDFPHVSVPFNKRSVGKWFLGTQITGNEMSLEREGQDAKYCFMEVIVPFGAGIALCNNTIHSDSASQGGQYITVGAGAAADSAKVFHGTVDQGADCKSFSPYREVQPPGKVGGELDEAAAKAMHYSRPCEKDIKPADLNPDKEVKISSKQWGKLAWKAVKDTKFGKI